MSGKIRNRNVAAALGLTTVVLAASALSGGLIAQGAEPANKRVARATLVDGAGETVGSVRFERRGTSRALRVTVGARKLSPGFHGFHVHTVGKCEGPTFMSAGPHLNPAEKSHSGHAGDMPPLLATSGGKAEARFTTDRFSLAALRDAVGSAVMVHALRRPRSVAAPPPNASRPSSRPMRSSPTSTTARSSRHCCIEVSTALERTSTSATSSQPC